MMENIHSETYSLLLDTYIKASSTRHSAQLASLTPRFLPSSLAFFSHSSTLLSVLDPLRARRSSCSSACASQMCSLLVTRFQDPVEKDSMFNAIENFPCIQRKAEWAMRVSTHTDAH